MKRWLAGFLLFCFALIAVALPVQAASIPPKPSSSIYVQDLAGGDAACVKGTPSKAWRQFGG